MSRFRDALLRSSAQRFGLSTGRAKGMRLALAAVLCGGGLVLAVAQIRIFASPEVEKKYKLLVAQSLTVQ